MMMMMGANRLYFLFFLLFFTNRSYAQITSTNTGGDWNTGSTWIGGVVPPTNNSTIIVDGPVSSSVSLSFNNNVSLTINSTDTLIIDGDLTFNNGANLSIQSGAVLIVKGNFVSNNNLDLAADAYLIVLGDFTLNNNSTVSSTTTPSQIYIGGAIDFGSGTTGNVLDCSGTSGYNSGCNYGNLVDLIEDTIISVVGSTCTTESYYYSYGEPSSNSPVAVGNTINLTANPAPGTGTFIQYSWYGPDGFSYQSSTDPNTSIAGATTSMTGYYVFSSVTSAGCYLQDSVYVLVTDCGTGTAYFSKDNYTGNWEDAYSWGNSDNATTPLPPPTDGISTGSNQTMSIHGLITVNGDLTITNTNYTICDTLVITGNLDVGSYSLTIASTGVLIVLGNYSGTNGTSGNSGKLVLAGEVNENYTLTGSGSTYIFDDTPTGNFNGGFSYGDETDLSNDDPGLYSFVHTVMCGSGVSGGSIGSDETLCEGSTAQAITNVSYPSPGGSFTYSWYYSTNSTNPSSGTWALITDSVREGLYPGILNDTTSYYRKSVNGNGCLANSNVITKTILPAPVVNPTASPATICYGSSSVLSATGGVSYSWSPSGELNDAAIQNPTYTPATNPTSPVQITITFTVTVTGANSCIGTGTVDVTLDRTPETGSEYHVGNTWGN